MLSSIKTVFDAALNNVFHQLLICLFAIICVGTVGCVPPPGGTSGGPSADQIFQNPPVNTHFDVNSGTVTLTRSAVDYTTICYTTDGSTPAFAAASCAGGSTATYLGSIELSCDSEETGVVQKDVRIVFSWNGVEQFRNASYLLTCSVPSNVTVFNLSGTGNIVGGAPGTLTLTGFAQLDRDTGILSFKSSNTSVTDFSNITTTEEGTVSGQWAEPVLNTLEGLTTVTNCINNGGLANGCSYVTLDAQSNLGITLESDPITFDLSAGGVTVFSSSVARVPPAVPLAVTTNITYTLTALDSNEELPTFTVGGTVNGLTAGTLVLELNESELLSVTANGAFNFTIELNDGAMYAVAVHTDPSGLRCEVSNGTGTISVAEVNNISVTCSNPAIADLVFPDKELASCVSAAALGLTNMSELTELDCHGRGILKATGIEQLTALTSLNLSDNLLASIDISNLTVLSNLNLATNHLTSIDLSSNLALTVVNLFDNWLTQIDTSSNTELISFAANTNPLSSINLQSNTALKTLVLGQNPLTSLDLTNNTALEGMLLLNLDVDSVDLTNNPNLTLLLLLNLPVLSSIDLTNNVALTHIQINDTLLSDINISANTTAKTIHLANNQLSAIDLSANTALTSLNLTNNQLSTINLDTNTLLTTATLTGNTFSAATLSYLLGLTTITNLTY